MSAGRVEVWRTGGRWYGHKKAGNHRIVGDAGEGYGDKRGILRWARREHPGLAVFDITGGRTVLVDTAV